MKQKRLSPAEQKASHNWVVGLFWALCLPGMFATVFGIPSHTVYTQYGWHGWRLQRWQGIAVVETIGNGALLFMRVFGPFAVVFAGAIWWYQIFRSKDSSIVLKVSGTVVVALSVIAAVFTFFNR